MKINQDMDMTTFHYSEEDCSVYENRKGWEQIRHIVTNTKEIRRVVDIIICHPDYEIVYPKILEQLFKLAQTMDIPSEEKKYERLETKK